MSCIAYKKANVETYCDGAYSTRTYCKTYTEIIHPMPELDTNRGCYGQIDPLALRRLLGRPRRNRKRAVTEDPVGPQDARRSSIDKRGNFKEFSYNKKTEESKGRFGLWCNFCH